MSASPQLRPAHVQPRPLADLLRILPEASVEGRAAGAAGAAGAALVAGPVPSSLPLLSGVTHDSRAVLPGDLYLARAGGRAHGAEFMDQAVEGGAVAVLTDPAGLERAVASGLPVVVVPDARAVTGRVAAWVYAEPADALRLVGITGTNGKTTTAYLVEAGLRAAGHVTGLVGTVETRVAGSVVPSERTTPEATDLQALLACMRERGVTAAAMEVSSHALALGRVDGTRYDVAVFTNLSQDHLDFHGDLEDYFAAKASLFTPARCRRGLVTIDDPYGARLAESATVPVETLSADGRDADWRAVEVELEAAGSRFRLLGPGGVDTRAQVLLPGRFNVANALAALAALVTGGVPVAAAVAGVGGLTGVPGRMERVDVGQPFQAFVDYAHTPRAVVTLLDALRPVTAGRLVLVLGCGGDRDRGKRPQMGAAAVRGADVTVLTSDNPRSEDPLAILDAMTDGVDEVPPAQRGDVLVEPDRTTAILAAVGLARAGDTVVVAGKGHEQGQDVGGVVAPFDDRLVLADALRSRAERP